MSAALAPFAKNVASAESAISAQPLDKGREALYSVYKMIVYKLKEHKLCTMPESMSVLIWGG